MKDSEGLRRTLEVFEGLRRTLKDCGGLWRTLKDFEGLQRTLMDLLKLILNVVKVGTLTVSKAKLVFQYFLRQLAF